MNSTSEASAQSANPTLPGNNDALHGIATDEEAAPLRVQLGEHLDIATRRSLQTVHQPRYSTPDFLARSALPALLAIGGAIWLWRSRSRR